MVFVIGGINMDITGRAAAALLLHDSNIGRVSFAPGGVGRNIAVRLRTFGFPVELIAPFPPETDPFAAALRADCRAQDVGLAYAPVLRECRSGVYICINDEGGDMFVAMNDMEICSALTPAHIDYAALNAGDACVLDANLPASTLLHIAQTATVPLFCDPVSVAKCGRIKPILPYLTAIKPNLMEATALSGERAPNKAAQALVALGVRQVYVSLGADGVCYADERGCGFMPAVPCAAVVNTTGAGDTVTAAMCAGYLRGMGVAETARFACEAAAKIISERRRSHV